MRKTFTLFLLLFSTTIIYIACSKGGGTTTPPPPPPTNPCAGVTVTVTGTSTNATTGQSNGSITASATGGSGFTFSLNNGTFQSSGTFNNLAAGNYTITAKNSNNCTGSQTITVNATNVCAGVNIIVSAVAATATPCTTPADGTVTVTASGSTNFTYSINGTTFQASNVFTGVAAGNYTVTAKDGAGCSNTTPVTVSATAAGPLFTAVRSIIQANCAISGCHTGPAPTGGIDFSNQCNIIINKDRVKARAVDAAGTPTQMPPPPAPSLSASDRQKITDWINAGGGFNN